MSQISGNLATRLTLSVLLVSVAACAQFKRDSVEKPDSAESIKLRSGSGNPEAGREKSLLCQGCHGMYGKSSEPLIPSLAGQYGNYIAKQLRNYQAGTRSHQIMNAMAATVNDQDLADIAAYFASQPKMKGGLASGNAIGRKLFLNDDRARKVIGCVNCHGVNGKGLAPGFAMFPVIGGQQKDYIRLQLVNFRESYRTNSPGNVMNRIAARLTDKEVEALAEYISAL